MFFLEYWKRKEITLAYQWDVLGFEEEEVRRIRIHEIFFHDGNEIKCLVNKSFENLVILSGQDE